MLKPGSQKASQKSLIKKTSIQVLEYLHLFSKIGHTNHDLVLGGIFMKKELLFLFSLFFFMSMTAITGVYAVDEGDKKELIETFEADVTGDGIKETISVEGVPFQKDDPLLKKVYIQIENQKGEKQRIGFEGGADPKIILEDFNQDGISDILISLSTSGSGGVSNYYLYTLKDFQVTDLGVPEPLVVQSEFVNGYKAKIQIENNKKTYKFNLKDRAEEYEQSGLYYEGKLNEPTELMVDSFNRLEPVQIKGKKVGLKGNQTISGAFHADVIGNLDSTWIFENNGWKLVNTKVKKVKAEQNLEKDD